METWKLKGKRMLLWPEAVEMAIVAVVDVDADADVVEVEEEVVEVIPLTVAILLQALDELVLHPVRTRNIGNRGALSTKLASSAVN